MYSKTSIKKHPIHPMLVAFPITLYVLTFVGFAVYNFFDVGIFWWKLGFFSNMAAVLTALVAAVPGFIDWAIGIPNQTLAKRDGLIHMVLNLLTLGLFAVNAFFLNGTWNEPQTTAMNISLALTGIGCLTLVGAGFYGWVMVGIHKVGVSMSSEQEETQELYEHRPRKDEEPPVVFH